MNKINKYILSYTAASLRLSEMVKVARYVIENDVQDLSIVRESGVVFGSIKVKSLEREYNEIKQRLKNLTKSQMEILANSDLISQKQIAFLGVCKHYSFIRDFTVEVVRDKALVFDYQIHESDYKSFLNNKTQLHPELEEYSESTLKKAKQVMFLILEQAGIINNNKDRMIQPQILHHDVIKSIVNDDPIWLKLFLVPDNDIKQHRN